MFFVFLAEADAAALADSTNARQRQSFGIDACDRHRLLSMLGAHLWFSRMCYTNFLTNSSYEIVNVAKQISVFFGPDDTRKKKKQTS